MTGPSEVLTVDCAVVGAGLSGLSCAVALQAQGRTVCVLEARDRVGGRVKSAPVGESRLCVGAQWIGPGQSRMLGLTEQAGLTCFPTHADGTKVLELGGRVSTYASEIPSLPFLQLAELQWILWRIDRLQRSLSASDAHQLRPDLDGITVEGFKRRHLRSKRVGGLVDALVRVVFGCEPAELSLLRFLQYLRSAGGLDPVIEVHGGAQEQRVAEGTHAIAEHLAAQLGEAVQCGCPVRAVEWGESVRLVHDRGEVVARRVVVATPPHLWGRIQWSPALPADREFLVQRFPMGQTTKVFCQYSRAFWREAGFSGEVVCDGEPVSIVYDNVDHEGRAGLVCFIVGGNTRRFGALAPDQRQAQVLDSLERWFGEEARAVVAYHEEDWGTDPWSGGCPTANPTPGTLSASGHLLRQPVGPIHWAGTEMATEWTGYMEGAVQSGIRAATEVLSALEEA